MIKARLGMPIPAGYYRSPMYPNMIFRQRNDMAARAPMRRELDARIAIGANDNRRSVEVARLPSDEPSDDYRARKAEPGASRGRDRALKSWEEISNRPARIARPYSEAHGATRMSLGRRVTRPADGEDWASYAPKDASIRPVYIPANDNHPRPRGTVVGLGEHREIRQDVPQEAPSPMRVRRNLLKTAPEQYAILCRVEELIRPADLIEFDPMPVAANDNNLGFGIERRHEVTPSNHEIEDLIQAYADGMRTRVIFHSSGSAERFQGGVAYTQSPDGEIMDVGGVSSCGTPFGLRFFRGAVMHYVKDGKRRKPDYRVGAQRGPDSRGWTPRETTSTPARPQALAELDRSTEAASFADAVGPAAMRQLRLVLEADSFAEIGRAYGYAASAAHRHGRRIAIAALKSAQEKIAA